MKTNYEEYLEKQMQDPEFRALYIIAREKAKLEFKKYDLHDAIEFKLNSKSDIDNG